MNEWISENYRTYFGNASSTRDFRVQMRGSRSVVFFTLYLGVLIGLAYLVYSNVTSSYDTSIVSAQARLKTFYEVVLAALAFMVSVVTPVMSANSIITEKLRHSLDLVFSAPVTPKYYMVGKLISSFRYTWMLLVLALPVTSACVVLGGASWTDVLSAYFLLSMHGVVLGALALGISMSCQKPVQAILAGLLVSFLYNVFFAAIAASNMSSFRFGGGDPNEVPPYAALSPFFVANSATTYSVVWGHHIPNVLTASVLCLLISKLILAVSGVQLVPYSRKAAISVRLHCLFYALALCLVTTYFASPSYALVRSAAGSGAVMSGTVALDMSLQIGAATAWLCVFMALCVPVACYTFEGELRLRPNGMFNVRNWLDGTPAGFLPFAFALTMSIFVFDAVVFAIHAKMFVTSAYWFYMIFALSIWTFGWGVARMASSFLTQLKQAQGITIAAILGVIGIPIPVLFLFDDRGPGATGSSIWDLYLLRPITVSSNAYSTSWLSFGSLAYPIILFGIGAFLAFQGEKVSARIQSRRKMKIAANAA